MNNPSMTPEQYCEDKVAQSGSNFSLSFLFLPKEKRKAMNALYAFCREVDDVVDECSDKDVARKTLQWWRQDITAAYTDQAEHPVNKALSAIRHDYNLPLEYFLEIIDGMEMDLDYDAYPTFKELSLYCYRVASVVGLLSAEIFGYENRTTQKYAHQLGMAFQLTNILRDVGEDRDRGRLYIPLDELERFSVSSDDVLNRNLNDNMKKLLRFQYQRANEYYDKAFKLLPEEDRYAQRIGLIMAAIYHKTLKKIEQEDFPVFEKRVRLPALQKLWLAWTTARKEYKRSHLVKI